MFSRNPYEEALELLDRDEQAKALEVLRWAGRNPNPLQYDEVWAEVEMERGNIRDAVALAEQTLKSGRETQRLHRIAAEGCWNLGLREEARDHGKRAGEDDARTAHLRARIAFAYDEWEESERLAERALALSPGWIEAKATLLAARAARKDRSASIELRLLWESTRNDWALQQYIADTLRRGEGEIGDDLLREVRGAGLMDASLLSKVMWYELRRKAYDAAIRAFDEAPEASRQTVYNLRARGTASMHKGDFVEATRFLEQAHVLDPLDEWTVDFLFKALVRQGCWRRALKVSDDANAARKVSGVEESSLVDFWKNLWWRSGNERHRRS